jgi:hypothetical protein
MLKHPENAEITVRVDDMGKAWHVQYKAGDEAVCWPLCPAGWAVWIWIGLLANLGIDCIVFLAHCAHLDAGAGPAACAE